jgi:hypothetical protein
VLPVFEASPATEVDVAAVDGDGKEPLFPYVFPSPALKTRSPPVSTYIVAPRCPDCAGVPPRSHLGTVTAAAARVCGEVPIESTETLAYIPCRPRSVPHADVGSGRQVLFAPRVVNSVRTLEAHVENAGRCHVAYTVRAVGQIGRIIDGCPDVGIAIDCENVIDRTLLTARGYR